MFTFTHNKKIKTVLIYWCSPVRVPQPQSVKTPCGEHVENSHRVLMLLSRTTCHVSKIHASWLCHSTFGSLLYRKLING